MTGWTERGGTGLPSFLDLYSKNFKISQIWAENFFFYLVVPPHKKFASVHPVFDILDTKFSNYTFHSFEFFFTCFLHAFTCF